MRRRSSARGSSRCHPPARKALTTPLTAFFIPTRARARRRRCWPSCEVGGRRQPPPVLQPLGPPVDLDLHPHAGARPAAAAATAVADFFFRLANCGSGWSRGWTSGRRGERPRPMGSRRDRRAVAHSGWGSQACSLSVDVVQRQRRAATGPGGDGARGWTSRRRGERPRRPPAGGASGRGGHLRGCGSRRPSDSCLRWRIRPR